MRAAEELDLTGGKSVWDSSIPNGLASHSLDGDIGCEILIIGSGITGSFLAERLSRLTSSIVVLDRHRPHSASTAASTSLLQWELDTPLIELIETVGFYKAIEIYRTSALAVGEILALARALGIECHCAPRPSLYISGDLLGPFDLQHELRQREAAGLPSEFLTGTELHRHFGLSASAGLYSRGAGEANPVALAHGLMAQARRRGVKVFYPETAIAYSLGPRDATVLTESGREVRGATLILANGYEMPNIVQTQSHRIVSTWALATPIDEDPWPTRALLWEASRSYLYARFTAEDRIILGGEDEPILDAGHRDRMTAAKADTLRRKFNLIYPSFDAPAEYAWAGFFGTTNDGLPLIGALPGYPHVFAAFGYGGNGITFSMLAARMIASRIAGSKEDLPECFAIDRD